MQAEVVILAGGKGTRMGGNKPMQPYGGTTLIEATMAQLRPQADNITINAGTARSTVAASLETLGIPLIYDDPAYANLGPLSGVLTALTYAEAKGLETIITAPCDMPHLPADMVKQLLQNADADIAYFTGARDYPLCALWRVSVRRDLKVALEAARPYNGLAVMRFLQTQSVGKIMVANDAAFANINALPNSKWVAEAAL